MIPFTEETGQPPIASLLVGRHVQIGQFPDHLGLPGVPVNPPGRYLIKSVILHDNDDPEFGILTNPIDPESIEYYPLTTLQWSVACEAVHD